MQNKRILPPTYMLFSLVVMFALHFLLPIVRVIPYPWTLLGIVPFTFGIALNIIADNLFHQRHTTVRPGEKSAILVTNGPFQFTRNPMYLGFIVILTGIAIVLGSLTPFVVIPVFAVLIDRLFIQMEEQMLSATFGAAWQEYVLRTRRWI